MYVELTRGPTTERDKFKFVKGFSVENPGGTKFGIFVTQFGDTVYMSAQSLTALFGHLQLMLLLVTT